MSVAETALQQVRQIGRLCRSHFSPEKGGVDQRLPNRRGPPGQPGRSLGLEPTDQIGEALNARASGNRAAPGTGYLLLTKKPTFQRARPRLAGKPETASNSPIPISRDTDCEGPPRRTVTRRLHVSPRDVGGSLTVSECRPDKSHTAVRHYSASCDWDKPPNPADGPRSGSRSSSSHPTVWFSSASASERKARALSIRPASSSSKALGGLTTGIRAMSSGAISGTSVPKASRTARGRPKVGWLRAT